MFAYLDKADIMHVVESMDTAVDFCAKGKVVPTDIPAKHGFPLHNGKQVIAYSETDMRYGAKEDKINPPVLDIAILYKQCLEG